MWATGLSTRVIARRTGMGRMAVYRLVKRISRRIKLTPEMRLGELLSACEPTAIVLVFALLERALEAPGAIRLAMGRARAIPEIRALLEPDDVRLSLDKGDGHRHLGMNGPAGGSMLRSMDGTGGYRRDGWVSKWHKEKRRG